MRLWGKVAGSILLIMAVAFTLVAFFVPENRREASLAAVLAFGGCANSVCPPWCASLAHSRAMKRCSRMDSRGPPPSHRSSQPAGALVIDLLAMSDVLPTSDSLNISLCDSLLG